MNLEEIEKGIAKTSDNIEELEGKLAEIDDTLAIINGVSKQTNLLALNATIEAARAGEAGKGFAVVANEVKELAKQSAKAAEEVAQKIESIREVALNAKTSVQSAITTIRRGANGSSEANGGSLFERLGGHAAVDAAVDIFYDKVLSDSRINTFFENLDMKQQRRKQKAFLTFAFGGAPNYSGKNLREAHKYMVEKGLNEDHFNAVIENLGATLQELNVPENLIQEAAEIAISTKNDILNR